MPRASRSCACVEVGISQGSVGFLHRSQAGRICLEDGPNDGSITGDRLSMATLLKIDVSPRGDHSISRKLGAEFLEQWQQAHAGGAVIARDLAKTDMPFVDMPWILGAYSPEESRNDEQKAALKLGDELIAELEKADEYVITTPMYNFAVPAALKAWIDHVVRVGKTFKTTPNGGYEGLLSGKKATVIVASAGSYEAGTPAETYNAETPYLKQLLGFLGVTDTVVVQVGGTYKVDGGHASVDDLIAPLKPQITSAASR